MSEEVRTEPPPKKRIGRARFLLEFIIAAAVLKAGSSADSLGSILAFLSIGMFLAIWASMKRLRDIKRSEWWAAVLVVPMVMGVIAGAVIASSGSSAVAKAYMQPIGIAYAVVYFVYVGVLLLWPSAFPEKSALAGATAECPAPKTATTATPAEEVTSTPPVALRHTQLEDLRKHGLITEEEFTAKRRQILDGI